MKATGGSGQKATLPVLGKQSIQLIHKQLNLAKADADEELAEINALTNPTIKKVLLKKFADGCDKDAVTLKAAALPRQRYQVICLLQVLGRMRFMLRTIKMAKVLLLYGILTAESLRFLF